MKMSEYQAQAIRTSAGLGLSGCALGLAGETGEVIELVKKQLHHGRDYAREDMLKELGDVLWYLAALASEAGIDLEEVANANIMKLKARYPDGYSDEASAAKADEDEWPELTFDGLPDWAEWLAVDCDGRVWGDDLEPKIVRHEASRRDTWSVCFVEAAVVFDKIELNGRDWKKSKRQRPPA